MRASLAWFVVAAALAAGCASDGDPSAAPGERPAARAAVATYRLHVDGMTCALRCVREVREMLSAVPGVVGLSFDVSTQTVECEVEGGVEPRALVDAVRSPYRARLL